MSCFVGLSVEGPLSQKSYSLAISEIEDYLCQANYEVDDHQFIFGISNGYQKFRLPKNVDYLFSNLQHFTVAEQGDQTFIQIIAECLMILKEYFPHKIQMELISDLPLAFNLKCKIIEEIPRRLASRIKAMTWNKKIITEEEVHLLIHNLAADFHKDYQQKIVSLSLKVLAEAKIDNKIWLSLPPQQINIIDQTVNDPAYQKVAIQVLERIVRSSNQNQLLQNICEKQNTVSNSHKSLISNEQVNQQKSSFGGPLDPMTALFQLRQSNNLDRISWIIENIQCSQLPEKTINKINVRIQEVIQKFIKGEYQSYSLNQVKYFGKSLSDYKEKRKNLDWKQLLIKVWQKIEESKKQSRRKNASIQVYRMA